MIVYYVAGTADGTQRARARAIVEASVVLRTLANASPEELFPEGHGRIECKEDSYRQIQEFFFRTNFSAHLKKKKLLNSARLLPLTITDREQLTSIAPTKCLTKSAIKKPRSAPN